MAGDLDIREGHDRTAKRLFSHADVVADLLLTCLPKGTLPTFKPETLRRFPEERVDSELALRRADIAWEFELRDGGRVVLLIEAQSAPDSTMASRMMVQYGMLVESYQRSKHRPPGILPVVFYSGRRRWNAVDDLAKIIDHPPGLMALAAKKCYILIDAKELASRQLPSSQLQERGRMFLIATMASASKRAEALEVLRLADERYGGDDTEFCRDLKIWADKVLWPMMLQDLQMNDNKHPKEITKMIENRFEEEDRQIRLEGRMQGFKEATLEFREKERALLGRQAIRKFGDRAGESLAGYLSTLDQVSDFERVLDWIVDCRNEAEILSKLPDSVQGA